MWSVTSADMSARKWLSDVPTEVQQAVVFLYILLRTTKFMAYLLSPS